MDATIDSFVSERETAINPVAVDNKLKCRVGAFAPQRMARSVVGPVQSTHRNLFAVYNLAASAGKPIRPRRNFGESVHVAVLASDQRSEPLTSRIPLPIKDFIDHPLATEAMSRFCKVSEFASVRAVLEPICGARFVLLKKPGILQGTT
jgi:hypothetical protein